MDIQSILIGAIAIGLVFGLAVFVHEFGHMFFALVRGVGVESFAIGMGPKIVAWKWRGIEFSLRWLPVGGFVKLQGMIKEDPAAAASAPGQAAPAAASDDNEEPGGALTMHDVKVDDGQPNQGDKSLGEASYDDLLALADKGFLTKFLVFAGGVFMNFVTAVIATAVLLYVGQYVPRHEMHVESIDSSLEGVGLQKGDVIVAVNGQPVQFLDELTDMMERQVGSLDEDTMLPAMSLTVRRNNEQASVNMPSLSLEKFFTAINFYTPPIVGDLIPHGPAEKAGIQRNDQIVAINGQPVKSFAEMIDIVGPSLGKEVTLAVMRGSEQLEFKTVPRESFEDATRGAIGIQSGSTFKRLERETNPLLAIAKAPGATLNMGIQLVVLQYEFFRKATFKQIRENLGGPIAIADFTQRKARQGPRELLDWFIKLNLLLAIFNLLPIPVLDGGFILLSVIEGIIRRPVSPRILQPIYTVFVIFFISLMLVISLLDINRFLS